MIVRLNSYTFEDNEAMVTFFGAQRLYNERGAAQMLRKRMVVEGELLGSTPAELSEKAADVMTACETDGGFCWLCESDLTGTSFIIGGPESIGGIRMIEAPVFTMEDGKGHFATAIPFRFAVEADYLVSTGVGDQLVSYSETIVKVGNGGPRQATIELDNGTPVKQTVSSKTPVVVIQTGEAVGLLSYPVPNAPILPIENIDNPDDLQIVEGTPRADRGNWFDYPVRWTYRFTLPTNQGIQHPLKR